MSKRPSLDPLNQKTWMNIVLLQICSLTKNIRITLYFVQIVKSKQKWVSYRLFLSRKDVQSMELMKKKNTDVPFGELVLLHISMSGCYD